MNEPRTWDESLSMGFVRVDEQHREILESANRLITTIAAGPPYGGLEEAVEALEARYLAHVVEEEWVMRWVEYPRLAEHVGQHRAFVRHFEALRAELDSSRPVKAVLLALSSDLLSSLVAHMAQADRPVGDYAFEHRLSG
jgi:hemerythrin